MEERSKNEDKYLSSLEDIYQSHTESEQRTWRTKLVDILHSVAFHWLIIFLVIIDAILVLAAVLIDVGVIREPIHSSHDDNLTSNAVSDKSTSSSNIHQVEMYLHYTSVAILCFFTIEIILKIIGSGKAFFKDCFEVFDAFVVMVTLMVNIAYLFEDVRSLAMNIAGIIVLLRLWRVTRIANSAIATVKAKGERQYHSLMMENNKLALRVQDLEADLLLYQRQTTELQLKLKAYGNIRPPEGSLYDEYAERASSLILQEATRQILHSRPGANQNSDTGSTPSLDFDNCDHTRTVLNVDEINFELSPGTEEFHNQDRNNAIEHSSSSSQGGSTERLQGEQFSYENPAFEMQESGDVAVDLEGLRQSVENTMLDDFTGDFHHYTTEDGIPMTSL